MSLGVTSGFSAATGAGNAAAGSTGSSATPAGGPNLFTLVLEAVTGLAAGAAGKAGADVARAGAQMLGGTTGTANGSGFEAASTALGSPEAKSAIGAFLDLLGVTGPPKTEGEATFAPPTHSATETDEAATVIAADTDVPAPKLLEDIVEMLGVLQDALDADTPLDPALEEKLSDAVEALNALLGIAPPQPATIDPAITAAAVAGTTTTTLDPLATIGAAATTAPQPAPADDAAPDGATAAPGVAIATPAAAAAAGTPAVKAPAEAAMADTSAEAVASAEPTPLVKELAEQIGKIAAALDTKAGGLAGQLKALADKLGSGTLDAKTIATLGLDGSVDAAESDIARAIERLLASGAEVKTAATAATSFTAPGLALPGLGAPAAESTKGTADRASPKSDAAAEAEDKPATDGRPTAEPRAAERSERTEVRGERVASNAATQPAAAVNDTASTATSATATAVVAPATVASDTRIAHAAYRTPAQPINIPAVAFEMARQIQSGNSRFQIRLDPPELGRIEVKLDMDKAGNVNARMTVERAETLDLMLRDHRALERALAQAGIDAGKTNLEFSLRDNPFGGSGQAHDGPQQGGAFPVFGTAEADEAAPINPVIAYRGLASAGGVNLFV